MNATNHGGGPSDHSRDNLLADHGMLPAWRTGELPAALPFSLRNLLRTIGPGAILLAGAIGGGEWIVGPLMAVKYGPGILWVATVGIVLQVFFNLEAVRYTLYTGEPILTGIMRLWPGPRFWGPVYILAGAAQLATPALAASCATVLFAAFVGRMPDPTDMRMLQSLGTGVILVAVWLLLSGRSIERVLEKLSWVMIVFIFTFLVAMNLWFVPLTASWKTLGSFLTPQPLRDEVNLVLLGLFAATAGSGGLGNLAISNWFRDKGLGMGRWVGGIGGVLAKDHQEVQAGGIIFPVTAENLQRWHSWWRYAEVDQCWLWGGGCFVGMFLNVNLTIAIMPPATPVQDLAAGAFQAEYLAHQGGAWLWWLALVNGFWILFSTHLGNTDVLVRTTADALWAGAPSCRKWPISRLYAVLLVTLTTWALVSIHWGGALTLFKVLGIVAGPILALAALHIWRVNTRFLPRELRPAWWRQALLGLCAAFYGGISAALVTQQFSR